MNDEIEYEQQFDEVEVGPTNVSIEVVDIISLSHALLELYAAPVSTQNKTFGKDKHIEVLMRALTTANEYYSLITKTKARGVSDAEIYVDQIDN